MNKKREKKEKEEKKEKGKEKRRGKKGRRRGKNMFNNCRVIMKKQNPQKIHVQCE